MVSNSLLFREKCLHHQAEIIRLTAKKEEVTRRFEPTPGLTIADRNRTPERFGIQDPGQPSDKMMMTSDCFSGYREAQEMMEELELEKMLADLREGSVEFHN